MGIYTIPVAYSIWFVGLFNKFTKIKYYIAQSWTVPWMWAARSKVTLIKSYDYKKNQPYVVVSNHLSNLDPMMQFKYLKIKWVFMAKKEVYKLPFFRTAAKSFNFIKVDRSNKNDRQSINEQAKTLFKNGWSIMVYPQGTRAKVDNFLPFKSGAFHIALDNNIPILPVVIAGTGDIWPRGSKFMKSGKAIINTLEPIDISKYSKDNIDQLVLETQEKMKSVYKELTASIK
jgi:1-acyl-sn-glycerol-3-phosphate acyltransferase